MIDLDRLDEQLELALTEELRLLRGTATTAIPSAPPPAAAPTRPQPYVHPTARPAAAPRPGPASPPAVLNVPIAELVAGGNFDDAEAALSAAGVPVAWKIMRALFEGRRNEAWAGVTSVRRLAADNDERYWTQRFWVALEWGDSKEQFEVLDHCRERAYRYDELRWRGALTVQLARMGRTDEAARELASTLPFLNGQVPQNTSLDVATNLVEAASFLGDTRAAATLAGRLSGDGLVVVGDDVWVCKGSMARFRALAAAVQGQWTSADQWFQQAVDTHRALGAEPLLARTLVEWSDALVSRDPARAHRYLTEGITLADGLRLTSITTAQHALAG